MVAIVILRQDENGNLYDQDGHLRNATGQKLDAQGTVIPDDDAIGAAQPVEEAAQPRHWPTTIVQTSTTPTNQPSAF